MLPGPHTGPPSPGDSHARVTGGGGTPVSAGPGGPRRRLTRLSAGGASSLRDGPLAGPGGHRGRRRWQEAPAGAAAETGRRHSPPGQDQEPRGRGLLRGVRARQCSPYCNREIFVHWGENNIGVDNEQTALKTSAAPGPRALGILASAAGGLGAGRQPRSEGL